MENNSRYLVVLMISFFILLGVDAVAMTANSLENVKVSEVRKTVKKTNVIYLLSWQDNKMVTTKGTFYLSTDITVINPSGLEKEAIIFQRKPPVIQIDKVGRQVRTITILPNTQ